MNTINFDALFDLLTFDQRNYIENWESHSIFLNVLERNSGIILTDRVHIVLFAYNEIKQRLARKEIKMLSNLFKCQSTIPSLRLSKEYSKFEQIGDLIKTKLEQYKRILMGDALPDEYVKVKDEHVESLELEATKIAISVVNKQDETFWK